MYSIFQFFLLLFPAADLPSLLRWSSRLFAVLLLVTVVVREMVEVIMVMKLIKNDNNNKHENAEFL
jgi:hypothetical protein